MGHSRPLYLLSFVLFMQFLRNKNCSIKRDLNSDCWSIRRAQWPLDHHHHHDHRHRNVCDRHKRGNRSFLTSRAEQMRKRICYVDIFYLTNSLFGFLVFRVIDSTARVLSTTYEIVVNIITQADISAALSSGTIAMLNRFPSCKKVRRHPGLCCREWCKDQSTCHSWVWRPTNFRTKPNLT